MTTPSSAGSSFGEPGLGGADAVPDTPQNAGHGTEPNQPAPGSARATVRTGGGLGPMLWVVAALVLFVAIVYLSGFLG